MKRASLFLMLSALLATPTWAVTLIKSDEAKLPAGPGVLATRGIARGPGIKMVSPEPAAAITSPFNLKVIFEPRGGSTIDPASAKVTYLKATPVDLLPRLKPGLSDKGITLDGAEVPPGEHDIQISIQDSEGRVTNTVIRLNVVK